MDAFEEAQRMDDFRCVDPLSLITPDQCVIVLDALHGEAVAIEAQIETWDGKNRQWYARASHALYMLKAKIKQVTIRRRNLVYQEQKAEMEKRQERNKIKRESRRLAQEEANRQKEERKAANVAASLEMAKLKYERLNNIGHHFIEVARERLSPDIFYEIMNAAKISLTAGKSDNIAREQ